MKKFLVIAGIVVVGVVGVLVGSFLRITPQAEATTAWERKVFDGICNDPVEGGGCGTYIPAADQLVDFLNKNNIKSYLYGDGNTNSSLTYTSDTSGYPDVYFPALHEIGILIQK